MSLRILSIVVASSLFFGCTPDFQKIMKGEKFVDVKIFDKQKVKEIESLLLEEYILSECRREKIDVEDVKKRIKQIIADARFSVNIVSAEKIDSYWTGEAVVSFTDKETSLHHFQRTSFQYNDKTKQITTK